MKRQLIAGLTLVGLVVCAGHGASLVTHWVLAQLTPDEVHGLQVWQMEEQEQTWQQRQAEQDRQRRLAEYQAWLDQQLKDLEEQQDESEMGVIPLPTCKGLSI